MSSYPVHVEVSLCKNVYNSKDQVAQVKETILSVLSRKPLFKSEIIYPTSDDPLSNTVERIQIYVDSTLLQDTETVPILSDEATLKGVVSYWKADLNLHIFQLIDDGAERDFLDNDGEGEIQALEQWNLPDRQIDSMWDSIIVNEVTIKQRLLHYCTSSMYFSHQAVDTSIISWNRMVLLYGPPGTGKTTLCKALAQKVYIRHLDVYSNGGGMLLEINSHSLFSKYFSESGKLVMKLFDYILELSEIANRFICVLIDEIESLVSNRCGSGANENQQTNDPNDAVRVVNAVLTSLDKLKHKSNVLVLCTSNMIQSIDQAFKDRCDICLYIDNPIMQARINIIHSCILELMNRNIIVPRVTFECANAEKQSVKDAKLGCNVQLLLEIAHITEGLSGRSLRKLPLKAHAYYVQRQRTSLYAFLIALKSAALVEMESKLQQTQCFMQKDTSATSVPQSSATLPSPTISKVEDLRGEASAAGIAKTPLTGYPGVTHIKTNDICKDLNLHKHLRTPSTEGDLDTNDVLLLSQVTTSSIRNRSRLYSSNANVHGSHATSKPSIHTNAIASLNASADVAYDDFVDEAAIKNIPANDPCPNCNQSDHTKQSKSKSSHTIIASHVHASLSNRSLNLDNTLEQRYPKCTTDSKGHFSSKAMEEFIGNIHGCVDASAYHYKSQSVRVPDDEHQMEL